MSNVLSAFSGMGETNAKLLSCCKGAKLFEGRCRKIRVSTQELVAWANGILSE